MTTDIQIANKIAIYSNETLREIVASTHKKYAFLKFHAKQELARRDRIATFGE